MDQIQTHYDSVYLSKQLDLDETGNSFEKIASFWQETGQPMRILDLGCGAGSVSGELVRRGHQVTGLDIMAQAVVRARTRGIDAMVYDLNKSALPFCSEAFDCVLTLDIIEHVFDSLAFLREVHRVLRPSGYVIADIPLHFDLRQRLRILAGRGIVSYEHLYYNPAYVAWDYFHIRFFVLAEVQQLIHNAGFHAERLRYRPVMEMFLGPQLRPLCRSRLAYVMAQWLPSLFASGVKMRLRKVA